MKKFLVSILVVLALGAAQQALADCGWFVNGSCSDVDTCATQPEANCNGAILDGAPITTAQVQFIKANHSPANCCCCAPAQGCCKYRNNSTGKVDSAQLSRAQCFIKGYYATIVEFSATKVAKNNDCVANLGDCCICADGTGAGTKIIYSKAGSETECTSKSTTGTSGMSICNFYPKKYINSSLTACSDTPPQPIVPASDTTASSTSKSTAVVTTIIPLPNPLGTIDIVIVIKRIIDGITGIIGAIAVLMFVWGGLQWILAAGNDTKIAQGRTTMLWASVGIIIILLAYVLVLAVIQAVGAVSP